MPEAAITSLRKFVRPRQPEERCDSCGAGLDREHAHTYEPFSRRIRCACVACATRYLPIPTAVQPLSNFVITDAEWDELMIPISLAFFTYSTPLQKVVALYPGPAGAAESLLPLGAWPQLVQSNPELQLLKPDVEALLVNRVGSSRDYFIAPIDECYKLVGLIRMHWRGLSGGAVVWGEIASFFNELRRKANPCLI